VFTGRRPRHRHAAPRLRRAHSASRPWTRLAVLAVAVPVGLLTCSVLVWHSSSAAFVATTPNPDNSWEAGKVELRSDQATAVFTAGKYLVPGSSGSKCITVTYTGNVDTAATGVRLYGLPTPGSDTGLAGQLQITVQMSTTALTPTPDVDCANFDASPKSYPTSTLAAFPTDYATGIGHAAGVTAGDWRPTATTNLSRTYKIAYSLPAGTNIDGVQGKKVGMTFIWEVQSDTPAG
jgi:hypothetical protein